MKKWLLAISALLAAGCMKEIVPDDRFPASDYIGFSVSATRAASVNSETIRDDASGFRVWATSGDAPSAWYNDGTNPIDGTRNYFYAGGKWGFANPVKWPEQEGYPMRFYAFYPAAPTGLGPVAEGFSPGAAISAEYTVQPTAAEQKDLLAVSATTQAKPSSGTLSLAFRHILSQVDFGVIAGKGVEIELQSIDIVNAATTRTYDFIAGEWMAAATGNASYSYFGGIAGGNMPVWPGALSVVADDQTPNPVYAGSDAADKHLMLMPQSSASWVPASGAAPTAESGAYVIVTYRMSTGNNTGGTGNPHEAGFADASEYPGDADGVTGPLFVKVGFPLPADNEGKFVWEAGKSYTYNLGMGTYDSCNGYILDEYYYDSDGVRTNLQLIEVRDQGKRIGDKLQDGIPRISVAIDDWIVSTEELKQPSPRIVPDRLRLPQAAQTPAPESISVNLPQDDNVTQWTLSSSDPSWLLLSLSPDGSDAAETVTGTGSGNVYLVAAANNAGALRQAQLYLNGDPSDIVATIGQNMNVESIANAGYIPTAYYTTYVGAFWKHNQIGERLIKINAGAESAGRGPWSARVVWMDSRWGPNDGVVLSLGGSPGSTVGTASLSAYDADAENFPVLNGSDFISSTSNITTSNRDILFRIGLKSTYVPTTDYPARYAVVQINYGTGAGARTQKLFLRQGEYDDYLMSPADMIPGSTPSPRTRARKFSPYNLTGTVLNDSTDVSGTFPAVNPGRFTAYPTQAGAMFHWASESPTNRHRRWAWPPVGSGSGWDTTYPQGYWASLAARQENCPPGYRRPTDGSTSAYESTNNDISNSEIRHSLWLQPPTGYPDFDKMNSAWGYYADGFFDRRPLSTNINGVVSSGNNDVAYSGSLFFNPVVGSDHYNASLFLPGAGYRSASGGLTSPGIAGHYHTATLRSGTEAWVVWTRFNGFVRSGYTNLREGRSIRCVRNPIPNPASPPAGEPTRIRARGSGDEGS